VHRIAFYIDAVLKLCPANRKRRLSALPNVGPYTYTVYDISRLRVNWLVFVMEKLCAFCNADAEFLNLVQIIGVQILHKPMERLRNSRR
jgi:hypothetical protein